MLKINLSDGASDRLKAYLGRRAALQLSLDRPGQFWLAKLCQNLVRQGCVLVFRIDQEAIHVEQTCTHAGCPDPSEQPASQRQGTAYSRHTAEHLPGIDWA